MDAGFFLRGFALGFAIAAPVGPIGVLCIRRTLANGRASGMVTGLGAATADALYGGVAAFGLTAIAAFLEGQQSWLRLVGGLFLGYLGVKTFLAPPATPAAASGSAGLLTDFASTFALTLTNPMTIFSFAAAFAGFGLVASGASFFAASLMVLGVFTGSAFWWLLLSGGVGLLRGQFNEARLRWVNRLSGVLIAGFGLLALAGLGK